MLTFLIFVSKFYYFAFAFQVVILNVVKNLNASSNGYQILRVAQDDIKILESRQFNHLVNSREQSFWILTTCSCEVRSTTATSLDELGSFLHEVTSL